MNGADADADGTDDKRPEGPPQKMLDRADELTPMLSQYLDLCRDHPDAIVLFQVGDFYEAFCEAAETVARACEVTLTQREDSTGTYAMAGIPIDNAASYLDALLDADFRVAIADQVEDAEEASGLVDRAVTNVVSPGTVVDDDLLERASATYLGAVVERGTGDATERGRDGRGRNGHGRDGEARDERGRAGSTAETAALATLDVSTGECRVTSGPPDRIDDEHTCIRSENMTRPLQSLIGIRHPSTTATELINRGPVRGLPRRFQRHIEVNASHAKSLIDFTDTPTTLGG